MELPFDIQKATLLKYGTFFLSLTHDTNANSIYKCNDYLSRDFRKKNTRLRALLAHLAPKFLDRPTFYQSTAHPYLVDESFEDAFQAIVNYCIMAIIQVREPAGLEDTMQAHEAIVRYRQIAAEAQALMERKNHDYGEAWRDMRVSSLTDLILSKILRIKQIEDNAGATQVSEGVEGNYFDMLNYSVFALIHLENC